jgi:hypothetical protein
MATLQAARASVLGLPLPSAKSWGLNRAIFIAAAKRGFKGSGAPGTVKTPKGAPAVGEFLLGDDKAYAVGAKRAPLFTIGGEVQRPQDFERQVEQRFAGTFRQAWAEALDIVRGYPKAVLESQAEFYRQVYRPRRDDLAKAWTKRTAGQPSASRRASASDKAAPTSRKRSSSKRITGA